MNQCVGSDGDQVVIEEQLDPVSPQGAVSVDCHQGDQDEGVQGVNGPVGPVGGRGYR